VPHVEEYDAAPEPTATASDGYGLRPGEFLRPEDAGSASSALSQIITSVNRHHGTNLDTQAVAAPFVDTIADLRVRRAALANEEKDFGIVFDRIFTDQMAAHVDTIGDLTNHYFSRNPTLRNHLTAGARDAAWRLLRAQEAARASRTPTGALAWPPVEPYGSLSPAAVARVAAAVPPNGNAAARSPETITPQLHARVRQAGRLKT
jgi:hypothetical protein